jgi:hypothetical protein
MISNTEKWVGWKEKKKREINLEIVFKKKSVERHVILCQLQNKH